MSGLLGSAGPRAPWSLPPCSRSRLPQKGLCLEGGGAQPGEVKSANASRAASSQARAVPAPVGFRIPFLGHDSGWPLTPAAVEGETLQRQGPSDALAPFPRRVLNLPTVGLALGPAIKQSGVGV